MKSEPIVFVHGLRNGEYVILILQWFCILRIGLHGNADGCLRECNDSANKRLVPIFNEETEQTEFFCGPKTQGECLGRNIRV